MNLKKVINPFFILMVFSCLYLTQIMPISPFYIGIVLVLLLVFFRSCVKRMISLLVHIFFLGNKTWYLLLPYYVAGLSFAPYFIPYMFLFIGIIFQLEGRKKL